MICPHCFDKGKEVSMEHKEDVETFVDPGKESGFDERDVCWLECPECGNQEDCDRGHDDGDEL